MRGEALDGGKEVGDEEGNVTTLTSETPNWIREGTVVERETRAVLGHICKERPVGYHEMVACIV